MSPISVGEQIVIPVLGMHRSGTSLCTRLANLLGMDLGEPLQPAGPDNPKGFWENRLFQNLNIQMLQHLGIDGNGFGIESNLYRVAAALSKISIDDETKNAIATSLTTQFTGACWGFKDPRTVLNYPNWLQILRELGYQKIRPILVNRRPDACAQSLCRRGDLAHIFHSGPETHHRHALNIWRAYTRILLQQLNLEECLVVCQEDLLNPDYSEIELRRIAAWIGKPKADLQAALDWIEPGMDHRKAEKKEELDAELMSLDAHIRRVAKSQRNRFERPKLPPFPPAASAKRDWCIYMVSPTSYPHTEVFREVALSLHHGMAKLGFDAPIVRDHWDIQGRPIVLGSHLLLSYPHALPKDSVLYNLEQVDPGSSHFSPAYLNLLQQHTVWDYSPKNIEQLTLMGVPGAKLCEIGHMPALEQIPTDTPKDIDVLFYGSLNPRRKRILAALQKHGVRLKVLLGVYGAERDAWIARSKIILNVHYYEAKVLEIVRLSYLLSNRSFVVSEKGKDTELEAPFSTGMVLDDYGMLVPQCLTWLQNDAARQTIADAGHELFSRRNQAAFLRPLILP